MSQPLLATWRVEQNYSVGGVAHLWHAYVKNVVPGGTDHTIGDRNAGTVTFLDVATAIKNTIGGIFGAGITWGGCELQQFSSGRWLTQRVWQVAAPGGVGTAKLGSIVTLTLRDTSVLPVKAVFLDTNQQPPFHYIDPTAGDNALDSLCSVFGDRSSSDNFDPWYWMVSRGNRFLNTSPFVSVSCDIDRITKKAHGL